MEFWGHQSQGPKLDVLSLGLEGRDLEIATIVAEETEAERSRRRDLTPAVNVTLNLLGDALWHYADSLPWDELLTTVVDVCAERARLKPSEVVDFASQHCNPINRTALFWFGAFRQMAEIPASNLDATAVLREIEAQSRKQSAARAAAAKVASDPKTAIKEAVFELWTLWQREPDRYPSQAAFAVDMLSKYGGADRRADLQSVTVVERWCRKWKEGA